ncbi:MAG: hypothetical protein JXR77_03530 [Lentisphaeria bacterium]|nr:hypothetical protein [Lentisphaeria bacterium]
MRPDPVTVEVEPENIVAEGIEEVVYAVASQDKLALLLSILERESVKRALVFRNRRRDVDELYGALQRYGVRCEMLSGDVPQKKRMQVLERFRKGELRVVVATDVAGRGIHIEGISHVINYDFPFEAGDYVHRIGRTGRAGRKGRAISFAGEDCAFVIPDIEAFIERELPVIHPEDAMLELPPPAAGSAPPHPRYRSHTEPRPGRGRSSGHGRGAKPNRSRGTRSGSSGRGGRKP